MTERYKDDFSGDYQITLREIYVVQLKKNHDSFKRKTKLENY